MPKFIRQRHESHATQSSLHIFFGHFFSAAGENVFELRLERRKGVGNRYAQTFDSKIFCEGKRVENTSARGKLAWHANAGDISRAESVNGQGCDHGRVDAAAQSEHGSFKTAFGQIIAQSKRERAVEFFNRFRRRDRSSRRGVGIYNRDCLLESRKLRQQLSAGVNRDRVSVEYKLIISPNGVAVKNRTAILRGQAGNHFPANHWFAKAKWGGTDI